VLCRAAPRGGGNQQVSITVGSTRTMQTPPPAATTGVPRQQQQQQQQQQQPGQQQPGQQQPGQQLPGGQLDGQRQDSLSTTEALIRRLARVTADLADPAAPAWQPQVSGGEGKGEGRGAQRPSPRQRSTSSPGSAPPGAQRMMSSEWAPRP